MSENSIWRRELQSGWSREACATALAGMAGLSLQPDSEQTSGKLSYRVENVGLADTVRERLRTAGQDAMVVFSHGRYVDVLPQGAAKGGAALYLAAILGVPAHRVLGAGDSANDLDLLSQAARGVVVGNAEPALSVLRQKPGMFFAERDYTAGLLDGLDHWRDWLYDDVERPVKPDVARQSCQRGRAVWLPGLSLETDSGVVHP